MAVMFTGTRHWKSASVWLLYIIGLTPGVWYFYLGATDSLGANPVKAFEQLLGLWTVRFLILTLAVSPARELFGLNFIRYRRALGLLCFYYALVHLSVYVVFDQPPILSVILADILKRPFIMLGMAAFLLLVPLAATSNAFSIRRLGKNWLRLHRLIYAATVCGGIHFALSTKVLSGEQYFYLALIVLMLGYRLLRPILKRRRRASNPAQRYQSRTNSALGN